MPKSRVSWTQVEMFTKSKKSFEDRYILGKPAFDSKYISFGKDISRQLEYGIEDIVLEYLHSQTRMLPIKEYMLSAVVEDVPFIGYIDSADDDLLVLEEYKSTKNFWTKAKAEKHLQPALYAGVASILKDSFVDREVILYNWQTNEDLLGQLYLTGEWKMFPRTVTVKEQEEVLKWFVSVVNDIENYYIYWIKNNV